MKTVICVFALFSMVTALKVEHPCSYFNVNPMVGFDEEQYCGLWYYYGLFDFNFDTDHSSKTFNCIKQFRNRTGPGEEDMSEVVLDGNKYTGELLTYDATIDYDTPGHYIYTAVNQMEEFSSGHTIIDTDYKKYAIEFVCNNLSMTASNCLLFILSREPCLAPELVKKVYSILDSHHIDKTKIRVVKQDKATCSIQSKPPSQGLLGAILQLVRNVVDKVLGLLG